MNHVEIEAAPAAMANTTGTAHSLADAERAYSESMAAGFEKLQRRYASAQQGYSSAVQTLYGELNERSQQAYQAYLAALNAAYTSAPSFEAYQREYRSYVERLHQLYNNPEQAQRTKAAYDGYAKRVAADPAPAPAAEAGEALNRELAGIWNQPLLLQELQSAHERYLQQVEALSRDVHERQTQAYRELLAGLEEIWSKPELVTRSQEALNQFVGELKEIVIDTHATVEESSARAAQALRGAAA